MNRRYGCRQEGFIRHQQQQGIDNNKTAPVKIGTIEPTKVILKAIINGVGISSKNEGDADVVVIMYVAVVTSVVVCITTSVVVIDGVVVVESLLRDSDDHSDTIVAIKATIQVISRKQINAFKYGKLR